MRETILDYHGKEHVTIDELNADGPFPAGKLNTAYAKYFVGNSYLTAISTSQVPLFAVSVTPTGLIVRVPLVVPVTT